MDFTPYIRAVADFPRPGIVFRDITPLLADPKAFDTALKEMEDAAAELQPQAIVGIESRGFIFGATLANRMALPFILVRKPGKLPAAHMTVEYSLEYGEDQLDIHSDALQNGDRAYIVDDLLATGGTARATAKLVELIGGVVAGFGFLIELETLHGRKALGGYAVSSVLRF